MSKDEFIRGYAERSGVSVEELLRHKVALPCACGYEKCHGWAMVTNDPISIATHMELYAPDDEAVPE